MNNKKLSQTPKRKPGRPSKIKKTDDTKTILDNLESLKPEIIKPVKIDTSLEITQISSDSNNSKQFDLEALETSLNKSLDQMTIQIEEQKKILRRFKNETIEAENYTKKFMD